MTGLAVLLVLLSAFAHSGWNFLTKRARNPEIFTWAAALSANVLLFPLAVFLLVRNPPGPVGWGFIAATWGLHLAYFTTLSRAYRHTDLSLAYPMARGTGLVLVPILGVFLLKEVVTPLAAVGIALVVSGIFTVSAGDLLRGGIGGLGKALRQPGVRYALATGLIIGAYSIVDKRGVSHVAPLLYMYFLTTSATLGMPLLLRGTYTRADVLAEWRANARPIVISGLLQFAAYSLVLTALTVSRVSYVAPFREIGIVVGVLLGALLLNESFKRSRLLGAALIVAGAATIALAP